MDKYWKLIDFCDKREVIDCETEEECISLIHDIIHRTVPSEEWCDLEITSSKIRQNAHEYVCYSAISDRYIRFFFYFYDANLEELDDELDHNRKLNAVACELSERSETDKRIEILEAGLDGCEQENEMLKKEIRKLKNERNRLKNIIDKTRASGVMVLPTDKQYIRNLEHLLKESNCENEELEKALVQRDHMLDQIRDIIYPF